VDALSIHGSRRAGTQPGELPRILVADDDPVTRTFLNATLKGWGYSVHTARDGTQAWEALSQDNGPSLAVVDWIMPGLDGLAVCRKVRELQDRYVYVILLTAKTEKHDLVTGLEAGADDYVVKPFDIEELRARLRTGARILALEEELRARAMRDALTGLWSRAALFEIVRREAERARRSGRPLSMLLADLDHFKRVNDALGHLAGDAVLREVAVRMQNAVRAYDSVGRYGGEEILVVLPECDVASAECIGERIRAAIARTPIQYEETQVAVTVSIGAATALPGEPVGNTLVARADAALYRAKSLGRNRTESAPAA
jgi:two-component system, cell cycle response regulator